MVLDLRVTSTTLTDDNPIETFIPQYLGNVDNMTHNEYNGNNNNGYEASTVNYNAEADLYNVSDILDEMRLGEPVDDDIYNDFLNNNNELQPHPNLNLPDPAEDFSEYFNNTFNKNLAVAEDKTDDMDTTDNTNELDLLLNPEPCSTPEVQFDVIDSTLQFQYESSDQFNCVPDMELPYLDELASTNVVNNADDFKSENSSDVAEPTQYFECSTNLPMTLNEIEDDIKKHFNGDQNVDFYDCHNYMFNDFNSSYNMTETENICDNLPDYVTEQNRIVENLEAINPIQPFQTLTALPVNYFRCDICSFMTKTKHGLSVHIRIHFNNNYKCTQCHFKTHKASHLKKHQTYNHLSKYRCSKCNFFTRCSARIKKHMRYKH